MYTKKENNKNKFCFQDTNWIENFKKVHGRPPKVLHIGNIANNAYNNAKLLRKIGLDCDVLCYDYYHIMGCPEWEDADFEGDYKDQFFPDWTQVNLRGFKRPDWFVQGPLELCLKYLIAKNEKKILKKRKYWNLLSYANKTKKGWLAPFIAFLIKKVFSLKKGLCSEDLLLIIRKKLASLNKKGLLLGELLACLSFIELYPFSLMIKLAQKLKNTFNSNHSDYTYQIFNPYYHELINYFNKTFPDRPDKLTEQDIKPFTTMLFLWKKLFNYYDVIHAYATDIIYPMLANVSYIAFEHGTLRELPFKNDSIGRLLALSYKKAHKVIITNPDTIISAKKLNLNNCIFIPHPLDEKKYCPIDTPLSNKLRETNKVEHIIFCPIRHDWEVKGTDIQIRAFANYINTYNKKDCVLILISWGNDINKSKTLIEDLGIDNQVIWIKPLNEIKFIHYINASDIILDQMILPSFGGVTYKAMSCAKPVIASFKYEVNKWCMPEPPPIVCAYNEKEVATGIKNILDNPILKKDIGEKSRKWIEKYHSSEVITKKLLKVYSELLEKNKESVKA